MRFAFGKSSAILDMSADIRVYSGLEWEEYSQQLLKLHYGPGEYTEVPDRHGGDEGIEGFSSDGCVYQCYAAIEPLSVDKLYENQRNKIASDIKKFIENEDALAGLFGELKIRRWILLVPRHDSKKLISYAQEKARQVREADLSYVDADFEIRIIDDSFFHVERQRLASVELLQLGSPQLDVATTSIPDWVAANSPLIITLEDKLSNIPGMLQSRREQLRDQFISYFIKGQNVFDLLIKDYPELGERVLSSKRAREYALAAESLMPGGVPGQIISIELGKYRESIKGNAGALSDEMAEILAWEGIADWLMRCPLEILPTA